jgi:myo-inositol-1(or 4)-monophosphatase
VTIVTSELRDWTADLTQRAATLAVERTAQGMTVTQKVDGSVVTDIDHAVERFLRDEITARFPDHAILGEEYGHDARTIDAPLWAIDPIDGTANLTNGLPHWGVSVGLIVEDTPVLGVVIFPLLGETFVGITEQGATRNGILLPTLPAGGPTTWEDTYAICSTSARTVNFAAMPCRLRVLGSAALEVCWTAAGLMRGCQVIGASLYDVAAGICIAQEVGASVGWLSGESWSACAMAADNRPLDALITAPPATLSYVRETLLLP